WISAHEAKALEMVNGVIGKDRLAEEVRIFARQLVESNSGYSMSVTKQMMAKIPSLPLDEALTFAAEMNAKARGSDDCKKGIDAFLKGEKIRW
ncbi:MAG TPA: enoyl-CoA hydratase-related protein, partial [Chryseosolibacter sp.]|nr:enoyl-CoA hydratase-related protein [Chryseosolibacter sp.]